MVFKITCIVLFACFSYSLQAQNIDESVINRLLTDQAQAWNKGDIEGYMRGYWKSDSLVFIGKNGPKYGYVSTLAHYRKSYPDTSAMGKLNLDVVQMKKLSPDYYFVIGKWHLQRTIGDVGGSFTLLIKKINNSWVIICDHSS